MNKYTLPIEIIDLHGEGMHLFVRVKAGRKNCRLLLDTGASRTVFDSERFAKLFPLVQIESLDKLSTGLGTDSLSGHSGIIPSLSFGKLKLIDFKTVILNLSHVNKSYKSLGFPLIDGVLGSDLLFKFLAHIDYGKSEMLLMDQMLFEK